VNEILSNYRGRLGVPSPAELLVLSDFEGQCTREIEELEARGSQLTRTIVEVLLGLLDNGKELKTKRAQIEICRSFRAPIHLLPPEVLSRIFQLTLPKRRRTLWTHSPQLLLRVCKAWKTVAESEPALWNVLSYREPFPPRKQNFYNISECWNTYSIRAAAIPLTIEILGDNGRPTPAGIQCVGEISSHFPRCISVSLVIESLWFRGYMAMLHSLALSNMESLSIRFSEEIDLGGFESLFDVFADASKLTKLKLNATPLQSKQLRIPFRQLTEFTYAAQAPWGAVDGESSIEALRWLIKTLVTLRTLHVYLHGIGQKVSDIRDATLLSAHQESSEIISFDSLKSITFRVAFRTSFNYAFRHFHFPALSSLRMIATARPAALFIPLSNFSEEATARLPFLSHLTSLSLIRVEIHPDDLLDLLKSTPLLSSLGVMLGQFLSINNFVVSDQTLLEGLIISDPQGPESPLVPHLQDLRLYYTDGDDDAPPLYAKLALSRFNWVNNCPGGKDLSAQRREAGLAYYPFRLYLKFERDLWPLHERVADQIGPLHSKIYHPEKSNSFLKEV